jgi:hypothetical protein
VKNDGYCIMNCFFIKSYRHRNGALHEGAFRPAIP